MKISIKRESKIEKFDIKDIGLTIQEALRYIKENIDSSLNFESGCRSGICGCCSVRVNGKEKLSCTTKLSDNDIVEPLKYLDLKKDLKVVKDKKIDIEIVSNDEQITQNDILQIQTQTNCTLCYSCYSACPVIEVNKEFLGPFILTKMLRYVNDKKVKNKKDFIDKIQTNGVWDCTLCGECSLVCPQGISPKDDINILRGYSISFGYSDPNFTNMSFDFGGF